MKNSKLQFKNKNWKIKKLGEVCGIITGGTPDTKKSNYWNGAILWATPKDLGNLKTVEISDTERKITKEGLENSSAKLLPAGAVLLTTRAPIGHIAIAVKPIATNQGFKSFICGKEIYNRYLYYALKYFVEDLQWLGRGATFTEISKRIVENFEIPLPSINEQKRVVARLEKTLDKIKEVKALQKQTQEKLDQLSQSVLQKAFQEEL